MMIYIVQKGDTLWSIAKKYGVPFETVKEANPQLANPDMVMPGMKIMVPAAKESQKEVQQHPFANQQMPQVMNIQQETMLPWMAPAPQPHEVPSMMPCCQPVTPVQPGSGFDCAPPPYPAHCGCDQAMPYQNWGVQQMPMNPAYMMQPPANPQQMMQMNPQQMMQADPFQGQMMPGQMIPGQMMRPYPDYPYGYYDV